LEFGKTWTRQRVPFGHKKYLQTYLNEYSFRYNRRETGNLIFFAILARVAELASEPPVEATVQNQTV
jgi:hypothetical protein